MGSPFQPLVLTPTAALDRRIARAVTAASTAQARG
jgi:hypothetical protein